MRYTSKGALVDDIRAEHDALITVLEQIPRNRFRAAGVWGDGWNVCDLVAHLAAWHRMLLGWHHEGLAGRAPAMPAAGYKWSETPALNRAIWATHRNCSRAAVLTEFERGYQDILTLVEGSSERELFEPGVFSWTGRNALTTYLGANTASHYRFAIKVINRWRRSVTAR